MKKNLKWHFEINSFLTGLCKSYYWKLSLRINSEKQTSQDFKLSSLIKRLRLKCSFLVFPFIFTKRGSLAFSLSLLLLSPIWGVFFKSRYIGQLKKPIAFLIHNLSRHGEPFRAGHCIKLYRLHFMTGAQHSPLNFNTLTSLKYKSRIKESLNPLFYKDVLFPRVLLSRHTKFFTLNVFII